MEHHDPLTVIPTEPRRWVVRALMMIALIGPGLMLIFVAPWWADTFGLTITTLHPWLAMIIGIVALTGAALISPMKTRDIGYVLGAVFYGLITVMSATSLIFTHHPDISLLVFIAPLVFWLYIEGAFVTIKDRARFNVLRKRT